MKVANGHQYEAADMITEARSKASASSAKDYPRVQNYRQDPIEKAFDNFFLFVDDVKEAREEGRCGPTSCGGRDAQELAYNEIMVDARDDVPHYNPCLDMEKVASPLDKISHGFCSAKGAAEKHVADFTKEMSLKEEVPPVPSVVMSISGEPPSLRQQQSTQKKTTKSSVRSQEIMPEGTTVEMLTARIKTLVAESAVSKYVNDALGRDEGCVVEYRGCSDTPREVFSCHGEEGVRIVNREMPMPTCDGRDEMMMTCNGRDDFAQRFRQGEVTRQELVYRFQRAFPSCAEGAIEEADKDADPIIAALDRFVFFLEDLSQINPCTEMSAGGGMSEQARRAMMAMGEDAALESSLDHSSLDHSATASEKTTKTKNEAATDAHHMLVEKILAERDHAMDELDNSSVVDMSETMEATLLEDLIQEDEKEKLFKNKNEAVPEDEAEDDQNAQAMLSVPRKCPTDEMMTLQGKGSLTPIPEADESCPGTPKSEERIPELVDAGVKDGSIPAVPVLTNNTKAGVKDLPLIQSFTASADDVDEDDDPVVFHRHNGPAKTSRNSGNDKPDMVIEAIDKLFLCYDDIQEKRGCGCMGTETNSSFVEPLEEEEEEVNSSPKEAPTKAEKPLERNESVVPKEMPAPAAFAKAPRPETAKATVEPIKKTVKIIAPRQKSESSLPTAVESKKVVTQKPMSSKQLSEMVGHAVASQAQKTEDRLKNLSQEVARRSDRSFQDALKEARAAIANAAADESKEATEKAQSDPVVDIIDQLLLAYDDRKERDVLMSNLNKTMAKAKECIQNGGAKSLNTQQIKSKDRVEKVEVHFEMPDSLPSQQEPSVSWGGDDSELMASINADRTLSQAEHKNIFRDISKGLEQSGGGTANPIQNAPAFSESAGAAGSFEAAQALKVLSGESLSDSAESNA